MCKVIGFVRINSIHLLPQTVHIFLFVAFLLSEKSFLRCFYPFYVAFYVFFYYFCSKIDYK